MKNWNYAKSRLITKIKIWLDFFKTIFFKKNLVHFINKAPVNLTFIFNDNLSIFVIYLLFWSICTNENNNKN